MDLIGIVLTGLILFSGFCGFLFLIGAWLDKQSVVPSIFSFIVCVVLILILINLKKMDVENAVAAEPPVATTPCKP